MTPNHDRVAGERILRTLLYYDLFDFPLSLGELERLQIAGPQERPDRAIATDLRPALLQLLRRGLVEVEGPPPETPHQIGPEHRICLVDRRQCFAQRREAERAFAAELPQVTRRCEFIQRFPLVEGVALSGTLSKGIFHPADDYDFFVVTTAGRIWICRTLLMLAKRLVLRGSHREFCVNYLVGLDSLTVPDRDPFTAMEVAWLRPVLHRAEERVGDSSDPFACFFTANSWAANHLPGWKPAFVSRAVVRSGARRRLDALFALSVFDGLDRMLRKLIAWRNVRRYRHGVGESFDQALRHEAGQSKHHPRNLKGHILERHSEHMARFDHLHGTDLTSGTATGDR